MLFGAVEGTRARAPTKAQRGGCAEGNTHHLLENGAIPVPTNPCARRVVDQQRLDEGAWRQTRKGFRAIAQRHQPCRHGSGRTEAPILEIIAPAVTGRAPIADPALELEREEIVRVDRRDRGRFLGSVQKCLGQSQAGRLGNIEQICLTMGHGRSTFEQGVRSRIRPGNETHGSKTAYI